MGERPVYVGFIDWCVVVAIPKGTHFFGIPAKLGSTKMHPEIVSVKPDSWLGHFTAVPQPLPRDASLQECSLPLLRVKVVYSRIAR